VRLVIVPRWAEHQRLAHRVRNEMPAWPAGRADMTKFEVIEMAHESADSARHHEEMTGALRLQSAGAKEPRAAKACLALAEAEERIAFIRRSLEQKLRRIANEPDVAAVG
jgi:hypothetical protein